MDRSQFLKRSAAGVMGLGAILTGKWVEEDVKTFEPPDPPVAAKPLGNVLSGLYDQSRVIDIGFENALRGQEHAYPLLYRATQNQMRAFNPKVEWLTWRGEKTKDGHKRYHAEYNFAQITRTPHSITSSKMISPEPHDKLLVKLRNESLHRHLASIENSLRHGRRDVRYPEAWSEGASLYPTRTMGGIKTFPAGTLKLAVLRDLQLLTNRQQMNSDSYQEEFLSEVSLVVS